MNDVRMAKVRLGEWTELGPGDQRLAGRRLGDGHTRSATLALAHRLTTSGRLEVRELADGLSLRARSWVGSVRLDDLHVVVEPKLTGAPLMRLLRYAYGLRNLELHTDAPLADAAHTFTDVLVHQLAQEVEELLSRGLKRGYRAEEAWLASPRGRLDLGRYVREAGPMRSALPCRHHPRTDDHLVNQALLGGLRFATQLTADPRLRTQLRVLASRLDPTVSAAPVGPQLWRALDRVMDRTTTAYAPALTLLRLLDEGRGVSLDGEGATPLPGFLFDMNRFFQELLGRFLREHLEGHRVVDELPLDGLMHYDPSFNPRRHRAPTPRPDVAVYRAGELVVLLDAKYRDLWARPLPREMLYQLAIYALSQGPDGRAVILYPSLGPAATDAVVRLPGLGGNAQVIVRPVDLMRMTAALEAAEGAATAETRALAARWCTPTPGG